MKVAELQGAHLDYWVARADGLENIQLGRESTTVVIEVVQGLRQRVPFEPSQNWAQGGPIIERESLVVAPRAHPDFVSKMTWAAQPYIGMSQQHIGPTPLIASMRAYVASKFGEIVGAAP